jgi:hypothetical protein
MDSALSAAIILFLSLAGMALGARLRPHLPDRHLKGDSKEMLMTALGMLATLIALVIGLLVTSAKEGFDETREQIMQASAKVVALDQILRRYGPETATIRDELRRSIENGILRIERNRSDATAEIRRMADGSTTMNAVYDGIWALMPDTDGRKSLRGDALDAYEQLMQTRWLVLEGSQTDLPAMFLVILAFWLVALFTGLSLLAPGNNTTSIALIVCALSMSAAILLVLEMNRPLEGLMQVDRGPLLQALRVIGR